MFALGKLAGNVFGSSINDLIAARQRASCTTTPHWPSYVAMLEGVAQQELPLGRVFRGMPWHQCWRAPPIAMELKEAFSSICEQPLLPGLCPPHPPLDVLGVVPLPGLRKVQKILRHRVLDDPSPMSAHGLFASRAAQLAGVVGYDLAAWSVVVESCEAIKSPFLVSTMLKTLANAWTTSYRMHELRPLQCLFGCAGEPDELRHYLCCPVLANALSDLGLWMWGPARRLFGTMGPIPHELFASVAIAFAAYHHLENLRSHSVPLYIQSIEVLEAHRRKLDDHGLLPQSLSTSSSSEQPPSSAAVLGG